MTFDATSREYCTVRRVRTNTPLQALTLLNDPAQFDAARALGWRLLNDPDAGATARSRAAYALMLALSRPATPAEIDRLIAFFEKEREHYGAHREAAASVIGPERQVPDVAELAAWTLVANVVLNLDEAVTKE
jgi:hypothetical protein